MKIHHGVCSPYTGGSHKIECYCGCADGDSCGVIRDADSGSRGGDSGSRGGDSGSRGAVSGSGNADSGNWGLTEVFNGVTGNI